MVLVAYINLQMEVIISHLQSDSPNILSWEVDGSGEDGQGNYDLALPVSPINENIVFVGGINIWKSVNGGISWNPEDFNISSHWYGADGIEYVHADQHIFKYNPSNGILLFQEMMVDYIKLKIMDNHGQILVTDYK